MTAKLLHVNTFSVIVHLYVRAWPQAYQRAVFSHPHNLLLLIEIEIRSVP